MCKSRTTILLLIAILVATGFGGHKLRWGRPELQLISDSESRIAPDNEVQAHRAEVTSKRAPVTPVSALTLSAISPATTVHQLSSDATALVGEMCDLQLLAHDTPLTLNSWQWSALAAVVLRNQSVRQNYEAEIATSKVIAPGQYRVEIPAYASAGDMLREKFNTELRTELGEATAAAVLANLGGRLEGRFAGFGVSIQTLDIIGNPSESLGDVQVTRTVTYWNSVEGGDRPTTRRETHFPAFEDPTGDSWSALLAMVKA